MIIFLVNLLFNPLFPWYYYLFSTIIFTVLVILIDGLVALVIRKMPEKYFDYHKKIFNPSKKHLAFYENMGVKRWKEKVPELGCFTNFRKNKIDSPNDPEYIRRYILEACYGVIIHYVSVPFSFVIMIFDIYMYQGKSNIFLTIALPVALVNAVLILLPSFILRYNLPKLIRIYEIKKKASQNND